MSLESSLPLILVIAIVAFFIPYLVHQVASIAGAHKSGKFHGAALVAARAVSEEATNRLEDVTRVGNQEIADADRKYKEAIANAMKVWETYDTAQFMAISKLHDELETSS